MKPNIFPFQGSIQQSDRHRLNGHGSALLWLTGLSGSGKSTLAHALEERLFNMGIRSYLPDGDNIRWFEKVFHSVSGPAAWAKARIVRYADDFVVMARYQGAQLQAYIESKIETWLGLEINRDKTKVIDLREPGASLDFLGFTFRYDRDLKGRGFKYLNVTPSKKAVKKERETLRGMISSHQSHVPVPKLIGVVNRQLRGWSEYFSFGYPRQAKRAMNSYVRARLIKHLQRRSQRPFRPPKGMSFYKHLKELGLIYL